MAAKRARLSARDRVLAALLPVLLVLVAGLAVVRHRTVDQSPWQGVGFGMFSGYDYLPSRTARATATTEGQRTPVAIPPDLRDELERVLVAPGDPHAVDLAEELRARTGADVLELEILRHQVADTATGLRISLVPVRTVDVP